MLRTIESYVVNASKKNDQVRLYVVPFLHLLQV